MAKRRRKKAGTRTPAGRLRLGREKLPKILNKAELARSRFRTLLNPFKLKILLTAIETGNWINVACAAAGIREDQLREWRELGATGDPVFAKFLEKLDAAEARAEQLAVSIIQEAATGLVSKRTVVKTDSKGGSETLVETEETKDWRAAAWFLEHRHSIRWAAMRRMQHTGVLAVRQQVIVHEPEDAELLEYVHHEAQEKEAADALPAHEPDLEE